MTNSISPAMRDVLIRHIDTKVPFVRYYGRMPGLSSADRLNLIRVGRSRDAVLRKGWIRMSRDGRCTVITETGRYVLAKVLANWSEALVEAALQEEARQANECLPSQDMTHSEITDIAPPVLTTPA